LPRSQPAPVNAEEKHYHVQPEIQHTFRAKEKIPAKAISGVFALLTLSPWFVLLGMVRSILSSYPKHCADFYAVVANPTPYSKIIL
jgi:Oligosaccharyltransferase subunit Ribophorin II